MLSRESELGSEFVQEFKKYPNIISLTEASL